MQSTYQSNHCLREILTAQAQSNGDESCVKNNDPETAKYLTLNAHQNEKRIRRLKIVTCYFSNGFNLSQFEDTNGNVIIAIGKFIQKTKIHHRGEKKKKEVDTTTLTFFYQFVRDGVDIIKELVNNNNKKRKHKRMTA